MPGETEPTPWELHRSVKLVLESLARVETTMLTGKQFEEYRAAADGRLSDLRARHAGWETLSGTEHKRLDEKIDKQADRADGLERAERAAKSRTWLAVGVAVLGALLSIAVTVTVSVILRGGST